MKTSPLTINEYDEYTRLINQRRSEILTSPYEIKTSHGLVKCLVTDTSLYFLPSEAPVKETVLYNPATSQQIAITSQELEAGRIKVAFQSFASSVSFYVISGHFDYDRWKQFWSLTPDSRSDVPATITSTQLHLPLSITPAVGDVFLPRGASDYRQITSTGKTETTTVCTYRPYTAGESL